MPDNGNTGEVTERLPALHGISNEVAAGEKLVSVVGFDRANEFVKRFYKTDIRIVLKCIAELNDNKNIHTQELARRTGLEYKEAQRIKAELLKTI